jgi:demethoxyubiquinone hydroxylase (CLK1/Coq7/Cat5 family)
MKITEIIEQLEALKNEHGDQEVIVIADPNRAALKNPFMKLRQNEITHGNISKIEAGYVQLPPTFDPSGSTRSKLIFIYAE